MLVWFEFSAFKVLVVFSLSVVTVICVSFNSFAMLSTPNTGTKVAQQTINPTTIPTSPPYSLYFFTVAFAYFLLSNSFTKV